MPLAPKHSKAFSDIADILYNFLPENPHPYANQSISFKGVAHEMGLSNYLTGGSKLPAISTLLSNTYEHKRGMFCNLVISIVNKGITYRAKKIAPYLMIFRFVQYSAVLCDLTFPYIFRFEAV